MTLSVDTLYDLEDWVYWDDEDLKEHYGEITGMNVRSKNDGSLQVAYYVLDSNDDQEYEIAQSEARAYSKEKLKAFAYGVVAVYQYCEGLDCSDDCPLCDCCPFLDNDPASFERRDVEEICKRVGIEVKDAETRTWRE